MAAVAAAAGVATGTAYVHYPSKDELLIGGYVHVKQELGRAAVDELTEQMTPRERFDSIWQQAQRHLAEHPERARFLVQFEHSSLATAAHERMVDSGDDPLTAATGTCSASSSTCRRRCSTTWRSDRWSGSWPWGSR